jgi:hypothetical protein
MIISLLVVLSFGCKKAEFYDFNPEENLVVDTATYLRSANFVSYVGNQLTVELSMVTFNGLECENSYDNSLFSDSIFTDSLSADDLTYTYTSVFQQTALPTPYSSAFLLNTNNRYWYNERDIFYYYRRYLEQIGLLSTSQSALAEISPQLGDEVQWIQEDGNSSYFNNSRDFSLMEFYNRTYVGEGLGNVNFYMNEEEFLTALSKMINDLANDDNATGEKSIVIFTHFDLEKNPNENTDQLKEVINEAIAADISLNFLGVSFSEYMYIMATETGGFMCENDNALEFQNGGELPTTPVQDLAVYTQNLHQIISHDVNEHRATLTITNTGPAFASGQFYGFSFIYGEDVYRFGVEIP